MNIVISIDAAFIRPAEVMLGSLARRVKESISVYLLHNGLTQSVLDAFAQKLRKLGGLTLHAVYLSSDTFRANQQMEHISIATYNRLLIPYCLPKSVDRALWLDADMIIYRDISSFYHQDFEGKCVVVADKDNTAELYQKIKRDIGVPMAHRYFNAGVILMNLTQIRQEISKEQMLAEARRLQDKTTFVDQDIVNSLFCNRAKYVSRYYNLEKKVFEGDVSRGELEQLYILHLNTYAKPWDYRYLSSKAILWWREALKNGGNSGRFLLYLVKGIGYKRRRLVPFLLNFGAFVKGLRLRPDCSGTPAD